MSSLKEYSNIPTTVFGNIVSVDQAMDRTIRPILTFVDRIAGPAYPVKCEYNDILNLHAAVYCAPSGSILVIEAATVKGAVLGDNFAQLAKKRSILGAIVQGTIRDVEQIKTLNWPVYCQGVCPVPGYRQTLGRFPQPIICGGVKVQTEDIIVADSDGVIVLPKEQADDLLEKAKKMFKKEHQPFELWASNHKAMINSFLDGSR